MSRASTRRNGSNKGVTRPKRRPQQRRRKEPGLLDKAVAALPGGEQTARRIATWSITGAVIAAALVAASWFGLPSAVGVAVAEGLGEAGFRVKQIEITGTKRLDRNLIYRAVLDQQSRAMPLVDLAAVRQRLLDHGWVADAQVSRRLPDTLVIRVVERRAAAVWQNNGQLMLIDSGGKLLEPVSQQALPPDLPVLVGDEANGHAESFLALMATVPSLKQMVRGANWIGDRRWTLTFESGEQLLLPEGDDAAREALKHFVEWDQTKGLLGRGYRRFDMRDPAKLGILPGKGGAADGPGGDAIEAPLADTGGGNIKV